MTGVFRILTTLCHPLLILTYGLILMLMSNPFLFGTVDIAGYVPFVAIVLFSTFVIPILAIILMRGLNLVSSLKFSERKERIGPLFATCILYAAFYFNVNRSNTMPEPYSEFLVGVLITLFCCLFVNSFYKVSLYAAGTAALVLGMFIFHFSGQASDIRIVLGQQILSIHFVLVPIGLLLISGVVGSGRIFVGAHRFDEVLAGWLVGILGQVLTVII